MTISLVGTAANNNYKLSCPIGRTWNLALVGTYSAAVVKVQFATAEGVYSDWATPKSLSALGELTGTNIGAHLQMNLNVASAGAGDTLKAIFSIVPITNPAH